MSTDPDAFFWQVMDGRLPMLAAAATALVRGARA